MVSGRQLAPLAVCLLALAGCVDVSPVSPNGEFKRFGAAAADGTGRIIGVVVDQGFQPVQGATVSLSQLGAWGVSDSNGGFWFSSVEPGSVVVAAAAAGYSTAARTVEVLAGQTVDLKMVLAALPSDTPYIEVSIHGGFWACSVQYIVAGLSCNTNDVYPLNEYIFILPLGDGWNETVFEQVWNRNAGFTTSGLAHTWIETWNLTTAAFDHREQVSGPSPLVARLYPGYQGYRSFNGTAVFGRPGPIPPGIVQIRYQSFPHGLFSNETSGVHPGQPLAPNQGVGATVQTPFQFYSTQFYYARAPHAFTSIPES